MQIKVLAFLMVAVSHLNAIDLTLIGSNNSRVNTLLRLVKSTKPFRVATTPPPSYAVSNIQPTISFGFCNTYNGSHNYKGDPKQFTITFTNMTSTRGVNCTANQSELDSLISSMFSAGNNTWNFFPVTQRNIYYLHNYASGNWLVFLDLSLVV